MTATGVESKGKGKTKKKRKHHDTETLVRPSLLSSNRKGILEEALLWSREYMPLQSLFNETNYNYATLMLRLYDPCLYLLF